MSIVESEGTTYQIDHRLKTKWDIIREGGLVRTDDDRVFIVDGRERSGKSLWTFQQAAYIDPNFVKRFLKGEPAICFEAEEVLDGIKKLSSTKESTMVLVFDEAFRGLSNRASLSRVNRLIVQALMEMGQKNLVLFIVLPSFFMLDRYPAVLRSNALFHIKRPRTKPGKNARGRIWKCYNYNKKANLYNLGIQKGWSYPVVTYLKGNFYGKYPGGDKFEKKYRQIKLDALHKIESGLENATTKGIPRGMSEREMKTREQRDKLLQYLLKTGKTPYDVKKLVEGSDVDMTFDNIRKVMRKLQHENAAKTANVNGKGPLGALKQQ